MIFEIDTHGGAPIYRQVMDQIRRGVMTGQLEEGEQVEQVRSLAARLGVNPMTVSKAYSFLEREGILERRRGVGMFVAPMESLNHEEVRDEMLEEIMRQAAASAVQLGVSEKRASEILIRFYRQYAKSDDKGVRS